MKKRRTYLFLRRTAKNQKMGSLKSHYDFLIRKNYVFGFVVL